MPAASDGTGAIQDARKRPRSRALSSHGAMLPPLAAAGLSAAHAASVPRSPYNLYDHATAAPGTSPVFGVPELQGSLVGQGSQLGPGPSVYGTDLGLSFQHRGKLFMLFGDTWNASDSICRGGLPAQDDTIATLPLQRGESLPQLQFVARPDRSGLAANIHVNRNGTSLQLGYGQAPMAGFSDGERAYALFERLTPVSCAEAGPGHGSASCGMGGPSYCSTDMGLCTPDYLSFPVPCRLGQEDGCLPGQTCVAASLCIDPTSSQYDPDSFAAQAASVTYETELAVADEQQPSELTSLVNWHTNKFSHPAVRTVKKLSGQREGNDYHPGHDALLIWGRAGFLAEQGRQASLYLAYHPLPLPAASPFEFQPRYFAGVSASGDPLWSSREFDAKPLALDGGERGDSFEE